MEYKFDEVTSGTNKFENDDNCIVLHMIIEEPFHLKLEVVSY